MPFEDIEQIQAANRARGDHWFDPETMRWWDCRVSRKIYGGRYFISSERDRHGKVYNGRRRYTLRKAEDDGRILTIGSIGAYASLREAQQAVRLLLEQQDNE